MPGLGWYLAQGLMPDPSSIDPEDDPCELPDGRLVCAPHGLVICGKCCRDYSFMDEVLAEDKSKESKDKKKKDKKNKKKNKHKHADVGVPALMGGLEALNFHDVAAGKIDPDVLADMLGPRLTKGTGRIFPTKFIPPSTAFTPSEIFTGLKTFGASTRYTLPRDLGKVIIRTDGACLDNGHQNPRAGWAFWHGHDQSNNKLVESSRLEKKGPFGDDALQTSNRAELRAVIAALRFRHWPGEGFHTLVIATDSEYAVEGATSWARAWVRNGWVKRGGEAVKNRDLWEVLLGEIESHKDNGMAVEFWRIPRDWNMIADAAAKKAAAEEDVPEQWTEYMGLAC